MFRGEIEDVILEETLLQNGKETSTFKQLEKYNNKESFQSQETEERDNKCKQLF